MNLDRTIGELTVRELLDILAKATPSTPRQAYGLRGIAELFGVSLSIPITDGRLNLGTWQGIYLCEFRDYGGPRRIVATIYE